MSSYVKVGELADLDGVDRLIAEVDGCEVVVLQVGEDLYAYENRCPHMGGPVGRGKLARPVEGHEQADGSIVEHFSDRSLHLVCPWHGYEFDVRTGRCWGDPRVRLRQYETKLEGSAIHVRSLGPRNPTVALTPAPFET